jgi:hypothetical protein
MRADSPILPFSSNESYESVHTIRFIIVMKQPAELSDETASPYGSTRFAPRNRLAASAIR